MSSHAHNNRNSCLNCGCAVKMSRIVCLVWLTLAGWVCGITQDDMFHLDSALHHYETLHVDQLNHTPSNADQRHHKVRFRTLGRDFLLHLKPNTKIFSRDFAVYTVDENGHRQPHTINKDEYYNGHLEGEDSSFVTGHISESGVLSAVIATPTETYHVEPSHLYVRKPHPFHMIAYKTSNVKNRNLTSARMDYIVTPPINLNIQSHGFLSKSTFHSERPHSEIKQGENRMRLRRQVAGSSITIGSGNSCSMILITDHTVHDMFGSVDGIISRVVQLMSSIDRLIYRQTGWLVDVDNEVVSGLGHDIRTILVHTAPSSDPQNYTTGRDGIDAGEVLDRMRFGEWQDYCLAHLFSNRRFPSGLLGLANIASPVQGQTGGICSTRFVDFSVEPPQPIIYNTGLTTFNNAGQQMVMSELIRVTGHELGHNWGSHHDPENREDCRQGYLMYQFAQDGSEPSHMRFSECSRRSIGQVLLNKGGCFMAQETCGNYIVDGDEECDAGSNGDICCDDMCFLRTAASCSDTNSACCQNCTIITDQATRCRSTPSVTFDCSADTFCDGNNPACPAESPPADIGTPCIGGSCQLNISSNEIECLPLCGTINKTSCRCDSIETECLVCCQDLNGVCEPGTLLENSTVPLSNGVPCQNEESTCINGVCTDTTQDLVTRIWTIITTLDINAFLQFVRENIVGFVLIFSIPLWCIGSCLVHFLIDTNLLKRRFVKSGADEVDVGKWMHKRAEMKTTISNYKKMPLSSHTHSPTHLTPLLEEEDLELEDVVDAVDDLPPPEYDDQPEYTMIN